MPNNITQIRDEEERRLWEASRDYMNGDIDLKTLEKTEQKHTQNLKEAVLTHAKRKHRKIEFARQSSQDEKERYLWTASRLYMSGEINIDKLEEIETPHTKELKRAIISLGKRKAIWHLLAILKIRRDYGAYTL